MTRHQKNPLRILTQEEQDYLEKISRAQSETASRVTRAKIILAVAEGYSYTDASHRVGRRSGDAVAKLVARFNQEGMAALNPQHGGGPAIVYDNLQREKILQTIQGQPERLKDGTGIWSLATRPKVIRTRGLSLPDLNRKAIPRSLSKRGSCLGVDRSNIMAAYSHY